MRHMMKFYNGHADVKGVYFDEENRRHLYTIRQYFADLARELMTQGKKEEAKAVVLKADSLIPNTNVPYGIPSRNEFHNQSSLSLMDAAYESGATDLANKISKELNNDLNQQMEFYAGLGDMTKKQLEDILTRYTQQKYMEQMQQQQQASQADAYLNANLGSNQIGLAMEMTRISNYMQYLKNREARNNPQLNPDTLNKKLLDTGLLKLNPDTPKTK